MTASGPLSRPAGGPIGLATNFGPVSLAAERKAIEAAAARDVELLVVHAIDPGGLRLPGGRWRERVDQARAARERDGAALVARARAAGVTARVLIWSGDAATCVVEAARAEGADRIFVGSHGRGAVGRAVLGSVSGRVRRSAGCPVEVIPADTGRDTVPTTPGRTARAKGPFDT